MFQARSVVGGYWMRVFVDMFDANDPTDINCPQAISNNTSDRRWFDLSGRQWTAPKKGIYIKDNKKIILK